MRATRGRRTARPAEGKRVSPFTRRRASLHEHVDFVMLPADAAGADIERLRAAGRIDRSSVNVVILAESGFERVRAEMEEG